MPLLLTLLGIGLFALLVPSETRAVGEQLHGFPDSDPAAHLARPRILGFLCFLPGIAGIAYASGGIMARYLARQFLSIFGICFAALLLVWLLQDLQNNLSDLRGSRNLLATMGSFYGARLPFIILELLPYALLLSLLYSLGKLSKTREIIAMLQTGRGLPRIALPLIVTGLLCTFLCAGLNYHWAPVAQGSGDEIRQAAKTSKLDDLPGAKGTPVAKATNVLYRNSAKRRLWMIGTFPKNYEKGEPLLNVEVTITRDDKEKTLLSRLSAARASWNPVDRSWTFEEATVGKFEPDQPPEFEKLTEPLVQRGWSETPWQLIKPGLAASYLGIPDLNSWLRANAGNELTANPAPYLTQWHYRWALPAVCLVTVLLAAPLGIYFSRQGSTGGVAMAIALSGALLFLTTVSLSLGDASLLPPVWAAWLPNIFFSLLGLYLFHRRMVGRPIYQSLLKVFPGGD